MNDEMRFALGCGQIVIMAVLLVVSGFVGGTFRTELTLVPQGASTRDGESFEEDLSARHWVGGLVQGEQPDLSAAVARHVRPGEPLVELKVITRHTWTDMLLTAVTLGIFAPETVTVRGRIGRLPAAAPAAGPLRELVEGVGRSAAALPREAPLP